MRKQIKISFRTKCEICGKELAVINYFHLKSHNITIKEYKEKFPESYVSYREIKLNGEPPFCSCGCGQRVKRKAGGYARWNKCVTGHNRKGKQNSEEQKIKFKETMKNICKRKLTPEEEQSRREKISKSMTGKTKTEEHIRKYAETLKNRYRNDKEFKEKMDASQKGNTFLKDWLKNGGKVWSKGLTKEEHPSIMSTSKKLIELYKDRTKHPAWQGGKSFEPYPFEFDKKLKHEIKKRDNYTCRECGRKPKNHDLHVHHIDYDKNNNNKLNLISLCDVCHGKTTIVDKSIWKMYYTYKVKKDNNYLINKFDQLSYI